MVPGRIVHDYLVLHNSARVCKCARRFHHPTIGVGLQLCALGNDALSFIHKHKQIDRQPVAWIRVSLTPIDRLRKNFLDSRHEVYSLFCHGHSGDSRQRGFYENFVRGCSCLPGPLRQPSIVFTSKPSNCYVDHFQTFSRCFNNFFQFYFDSSCFIYRFYLLVTVATAAGIAAILRGRFSGASFLRRQLLDRFS